MINSTTCFQSSKISLLSLSPLFVRISAAIKSAERKVITYQILPKDCSQIWLYCSRDSPFINHLQLIAKLNAIISLSLTSSSWKIQMKKKFLEKKIACRELATIIKIISLFKTKKISLSKMRPMNMLSSYFVFPQMRTVQNR